MKRIVLACLALLVVVALPTSLTAQGIAPVLSDSVYHQAVDSANYKQYAFVYLLDDGVVKLESRTVAAPSGTIRSSRS